jgi:hypothetical protein
VARRARAWAADDDRVKPRRPDQAPRVRDDRRETLPGRPPTRRSCLRSRAGWWPAQLGSGACDWWLAVGNLIARILSSWRFAGARQGARDAALAARSMRVARAVRDGRLRRGSPGDRRKVPVAPGGKKVDECVLLFCACSAPVLPIAFATTCSGNRDKPGDAGRNVMGRSCLLGISRFRPPGRPEALFASAGTVGRPQSCDRDAVGRGVSASSNELGKRGRQAHHRAERPDLAPRDQRERSPGAEPQRRWRWSAHRRRLQ